MTDATSNRPDEIDDTSPSFTQAVDAVLAALTNRLRFERNVQPGDEHDRYDCYLGLDAFSRESCECRCHERYDEDAAQDAAHGRPHWGVTS